MTARYARAAYMAAQAHAGQLRKGGDTPYINHPLQVAARVAEETTDEDMLCAAVLHDVVEDSSVTLAEIAAAFGDRVAGLVDQLTDPPEWDDLYTLERKARQAREYRSASPEAQTIKIADQWSNVAELAQGTSGKDAKWLKGYLEASRAVVEACRPAAPDLARSFDAAAEALSRHIAGMRR